MCSRLQREQVWIRSHFFERREFMHILHPLLQPAKHAHGRRHRRYSPMQLKQMAIIVGFIILATLISVLLPAYFAYLPVAGG